MKESCLFYYTIAIGGLGSGFQHGWNAAVLNAPSEVIQNWIKSLNLPYLENEWATSFYWGFVQSVFTIGGIIGGFVSALIILIGGRKGGLMINDCIAIMAGVIMFVTKIANDPTWLVVGRCLVGINCGANGSLCNIYLTEISPVRLRGAVGSLYQLFLTFALMLATIAGIEPLLGTDNYWPYLFIIVSIMGVVQLVGLMPSPESAKYILDKSNDEEKARKAFNRIHGKKETAEEEFSAIKAESAAGKAQPKISCGVFFTQKIYIKPLGICFFLMVAQQLSGINAVIFYSTDIFKKAHLSDLDSQLCTVGIGVINFMATVVGVLIIDKTGRKPLLLWGFVIMAVSTSCLTGFLYLVDTRVWARWLCLVFILVFIVAFAIGAGPIPWLIGSEMFFANARPIAYAILVPTNWFFNLIVCLCFPPLQELMGPLVFIIFIVFQVISVVVIYFWMPETKNKTVEEIVQSFT